MCRISGVAAAWLLAAAYGRAGPVQDAQCTMAGGGHAQAASRLAGSVDVEALVLRVRALFVAKRYREAEAAYRWPGVATIWLIR